MEDAIPKLEVVLKPSFDLFGVVQDLRVNLSVDQVNIGPGESLLAFDNAIGESFKKGKYRISAWGPTGSLDLLVVGTGNNTWELRPHRQIAENATIEILITALGVNFTGLDIDQGGMIGVGRAFLPRLPHPDTWYHNIIKWDLSGASGGIRALCSHGEGPEAVIKDGLSKTILDTVYMVGPIRSAPGPDQVSLENPTCCSTYWFGDLPPNLAAVQWFSAALFPRMATHFQDPRGSYRVFLQKTNNGVCGRNEPGCSILQYDDSILDASDNDLVRWLTRHMVLNWIGLDDEDENTTNEWYSEGLAHLYSVYLPFRFGQRSSDYFKSTINAFLTAGYTNPRHDAAPGYLSASLSSNLPWYTKQTAPFRACVYMLKMDSYMRRSSRERDAGVLRPIDEIVTALSTRKSRGEKVQTKDWLGYVSEWLGDEAATRYFQNMMDGGVMELDDMKSSFGASHEPVAVEQELLCFGMNLESFNSRTVLGIIPGSRAERAGLKNGDSILAHSWIWGCVTNFERMMEIVVEREGTELKFSYWPRDWRKTRSWQVMKIDVE